MFTKPLIAAAALASSLVAIAPEQAKADVDWNIGVNLGHPGIYPGYGYGYGYEPVHPVHPVYAPSKISCWQGKKAVRWSGFYNVQPVDCQGSAYRYTARKGGAFYRVTVNAFSGQIVKVRPYAVY
jgi:hypothetical protein